MIFDESIVTLDKRDPVGLLSDPRSLGEELYDYWVSLMITDGVDGVGHDLKFSTIAEDAREDFVEAVKVKVTDRIEKMMASIEIKKINDGWAAVAEAAAELPIVKKPCYGCGIEPVEVRSDRVGLCKNCGQ